MTKKGLPFEERFWSKVDKGSDDECWNWNAAITPKGYPVIGADKTNKTIKAHRVSWELINGEIPEGMMVLHKCDNSKCVNPKHLYLGTHQDNMDDKAERDRSRNYVLSDQDVRDIRAMKKKNVSYRKIAKKYGVSGQLIYLIVKRKSHKHVM